MPLPHPPDPRVLVRPRRPNIPAEPGNPRHWVFASLAGILLDVLLHDGDLAAQLAGKELLWDHRVDAAHESPV
jgi:hypothetical protein